jgi:hypothetical protein
MVTVLSVAVVTDTDSSRVVCLLRGYGDFSASDVSIVPQQTVEQTYGPGKVLLDPYRI